MANKGLSDKNYRCRQCEFGFTTFDDEPGEYRCEKLGGKKAEEIEEAHCPKPEIDAIERAIKDALRWGLH